ncbi:MAG: Hsp20/alpha crystallin family protein [Clostridia bacterium]|nr:Hsp20/alpha crystallin family protein [Clostridia bacterium]
MFEIRPFNNKNRSELDPFRRMEELQRAFFSDPFGFWGDNRLAQFKTDITDQGDSYLLEADLPGFDKKDISLEITNDVLIIRAERNTETEEEDKKTKYVHRERSYGSYTRLFDISAIESENIMEKYENGVLKITLPKKKENASGSKKLDIE